jgi:hypothetical protein
VVLKESQIHVGERALIEHLDAYTAPRLVEYFDGDPCMRYLAKMQALGSADAAAPAQERERRANALGVTIEAQYTVGEYDILILSAKESRGLEIWLTENGYRVPGKASRVLRSYLKQGLKFFVARVNLEQQGKLGLTYLRPLQIAFESPRFMLPIRLGMANARSSQELYIYTLTKNGRVETTNYRTVKMPTGNEIPLYVKDRFADFYRAMFDRQVRKENMRTVFLEYAWAMNLCDPCSADPLSTDELRELGVFWLGDTNQTGRGAPQVFVTRLHVRYDDKNFPEDLVLQETGDQSSFQGRYVMRHPWTGEATCDGAIEYRESLRKRQEQEARTLASLTGWNVNEIRSNIDFADAGPQGEKPWWQKIWQN